jgi:hypothetical protein
VPKGAREREFMTQWLAGSLSADEHIIADLRGIAGPGRRFDLGTVALLALPDVFAAWHDYFYGTAGGRPGLAVIILLPAAAGAITFASAALRKIIYVAVTERQVIFVKMRKRSTPDRVLLAAPIIALRLKTTDRLGQRTVICTAADGGALLIDGKCRRRLRLAAMGRRPGFGEALNAIRAQGGLVDLSALPVPALDRSA